MLELHDICNVINARQYWSRIISLDVPTRLLHGHV